jgi:hypothetical protein
LKIGWHGLLNDAYDLCFFGLPRIFRFVEIRYELANWFDLIDGAPETRHIERDPIERGASASGLQYLRRYDTPA